MTANMNWNSMYTIRMFITFFKEFTKQSNTAFSFGTRFIVFNGLSTRSTRRDLIVERLAPAAPPPPLQPKSNNLKLLGIKTESIHEIEPHGDQGADNDHGIHNVPKLPQVWARMKNHP